MFTKLIPFAILIALSAAQACQPPVNCQPQYQSQANVQYQQPHLQIQPPFQSTPQFTSFTSPVQSTDILNCIFTNDASTSTYDCSSTNTTIRSEGAGFNGLDGSHTSNHSNFDVNGLKISSQVCFFVPADLSSIMPRLKKLEITYSGLLAIDESDTSGLPELQYLNLKGNRIGRLSFRLFRFNHQLVSMDFSDNFIKAVAEDLLVPFDHMRFIDFSNNICVKDQPASDNFRAWDRELRRNCVPADRFSGVSEPLWSIVENTRSR